MFILFERVTLNGFLQPWETIGLDYQIQVPIWEGIEWEKVRATATKIHIAREFVPK